MTAGVQSSTNTPAPTCIRMSCERGSIEARVGVAHAEMVTRFASLLTEDTRSDTALAEFLVDQIDGRATAEEAWLAKAHPGYAEDVASKVAIFALGLLFRRPDLAKVVSASLHAGGHMIDIQLSGSHVLVQINGHSCSYETNFVIAGNDGMTAALH